MQPWFFMCLINFKLATCLFISSSNCNFAPGCLALFELSWGLTSYIKTANELLADSKAGWNSVSGFTPSVNEHISLA